MAKTFTKLSGTQVLLTDDSTGNILAKIQAERNNPHWDVVWFDGDATMQSLNNQGLLLKWAPANLKNYTKLGQSLVPADHAFFPTGVTAAGVIVYNTKHLSAAHAPKDWTDLLTPAFKNGVAENDPAFSGPAFPYIAGQLLRQGGKDLKGARPSSSSSRPMAPRYSRPMTPPSTRCRPAPAWSASCRTPPTTPRRRPAPH
jgi:iron(III) transport system substrate-binding protein